VQNRNHDYTLLIAQTVSNPYHKFDTGDKIEFTVIPILVTWGKASF
jgi:hypothetical protein